MRRALELEISELEVSLNQIHPSAEAYGETKSKLHALREQLAAQTAKNESMVSGLKEVIYQLFDSVIPIDTGNHAFGINDFQEKGETFRQMVDIAVDENNTALNEYIADLLESKDAKISELNAQIIASDANLQESLRKEQNAIENYERSLRENEGLEQKIATINGAHTDTEAENRDLREQLKAKDEQITKLTEEFNKPKPSGIILPHQAKPSDTLQQMMEAAKNKSVKTSIELALMGQATRGKVSITPPVLGGGETASETFQRESFEAHFTDGGIPLPEIQTLSTPSEETTGTEVSFDGAMVQETSGYVTQEQLARLAARVAQLEQSKVTAA